MSMAAEFNQIPSTRSFDAGRMIACALGLVAASTSAAHAIPVIDMRTSANFDTLSPNTMGVRAHRVVGVSSLVYDLKRKSGLTWDELAGVMGVTRRTAHLWANGGAISAANEQRLRRLAHTVEGVARPSARETRALLLQPLADGLLIDLLRTERFEEFRMGVLLAAQSTQNADARMSDEPAILATLGTLEDRPSEPGKFLRIGRRAKQKP